MPPGRPTRCRAPVRPAAASVRSSPVMRAPVSLRSPVAPAAGGRGGAGSGAGATGAGEGPATRAGGSSGGVQTSGAGGRSDRVRLTDHQNLGEKIGRHAEEEVARQGQ